MRLECQIMSMRWVYDTGLSSAEGTRLLRRRPSLTIARLLAREINCLFGLRMLRRNSTPFLGIRSGGVIRFSGKMVGDLYSNATVLS